MPKKPADLPIYWRGGRAYLDGRRWGQGRRPLCLPGESWGVTDPTVAKRLARQLVDGWEQAEITAARLGLKADNDLATAGDAYVKWLREDRRRTNAYANYTLRCLQRALLFFDTLQAEQAQTAAERKRCTGPRNLQTISPPDVRAFMKWLRQQPGGRRGNATLSDGTVREHLAALSGVFTLAISDGHLPMGSNPVAALLDKPSAPKTRTELLEPHECALLLESARTLNGQGGQGGRAALRSAHALIGFFLYTGAREEEVRRAEVADLHFDASPAHPHGWIRIRGTKTDGAERVVPMHPHHVEILKAHLRATGRAGGLLFTTNDGERLGDWRKTLDLVARRAGYPDGAIRTRRFRTSYASHRCTCEGADVNTIRLEMGHSDLAMLAKVYAAAQRRSERMGAEFSYRLERWVHHVDGDTLRALAA